MCVGARVFLYMCVLVCPRVCQRTVCVSVSRLLAVCVRGWCVTKCLVGCHILPLESDGPALLQAEPRFDEPD